MTLHLEYRCGANFKTPLSVPVGPDFDLKVGGQITMGEYGTPTKEEFFESTLHPHKYDEELDHELLDVLEIT